MKASSLFFGTLAISASIFWIAMAMQKKSIAANGVIVCPDPNQGETPLDCPWAGVSRELLDVASHQGSVIEALERMNPTFVTGLKMDSHRKDWLALWGLCINRDELTQGVIVPPAIIDPMVKLFAPYSGAPFMVGNQEIVHAGVQHTYGYLFSNLRTSFGYKRARWVRPTLDAGFGLPNGTLSPIPRSGTLFSNVTYFAGRIAFRNEPAVLGMLESQSKQAISPAVATFNYSRLRPARLEETIKTETGDVVLRTDLVPFLRPVIGDSNRFWLIYSVSDRRSGRKLPESQLITAFPVETSFAERIFKPSNLGENKAIITRYNAYVPGITGTQAVGTRRKL